jgi:hypothetical protein
MGRRLKLKVGRWTNGGQPQTLRIHAIRSDGVPYCGRTVETWTAPDGVVH